MKPKIIDRNPSVSRTAGFLCASLFVVGTLTGCKTFKPVEDLTRYYVLSPSAVPSTRAYTNQSFAIGIAPVEIPAYLQTTHIVLRRGTNEISYSESSDWAEHLDKGIQRIVAADIELLRPEIRTVISAWQSQDVKAEVYISIQRFELDERGNVTLDSQWRIVAPGSSRAGHSSINKKGPSLAKDPSAAVGTLSASLLDLSKDLATALQKQ
jgi:uncharacterized lipoprotein YmbA